MLVDDEEAVQNQLDKICGSNHDLFSHIRVPRQRIHVEINTGEQKGTDVAEGDLARRKDVEISLEKTSIVKSTILTHFINGKISLTPMETILTIPGELEYVEGLVKLARRCKNEEHITIPTNVMV
jgi:hypothetical protein